MSVSVSPGPVSAVSPVSPCQCQGWLRLSRVSPASCCDDEDRTSEDNFLPQQLCCWLLLGVDVVCRRMFGAEGQQLMQRRAPPALLVLTPDRITARQGETSRPATTSQQDQNRF